MTQHALTFSCTLAVLLAGAPALALDPKASGNLRNMESAMSSCDPGDLWDGTAPKPNAPPQKLQSWIRSCQSNLARARGYWDKLSPLDQADPSAQRLWQRLKSYDGFGRAAAGMVQGAAANREASLDLCRKFKAIKAAPANAGMNELVQVLRNPRAQTASWCQKPESIAKIKSAAESALRACTENPDIAKLPDNGCSAIYGAENPASWCEAAGKAPEFLRQAVASYLAQEVEIEMARKNISKPEDVERREGWTEFEGPVEWKRDLYFGDKAREEFKARYAKVLAAADVKELDPTFLARLGEMRDKLRAVVERLASTWKLPASGSSHYGVALAEKRIKSWHPQAKIQKGFMGAADWSISKNELDIPKYRDRTGYVLFQLPGEPYCQLRVFVVSEDHQGGGKYQPASDVHVGGVRFQACK